MKNLENLALKVTEQNVTKKRKVKNINESLVEILYKKEGDYTRENLIAIISLKRLQNDVGLEELERLASDEDKFREALKPYNKTVKNGLDQSFAQGQNNASFHYNPKYSKMKLFIDDEGYARIIDRK